MDPQFAKPVWLHHETLPPAVALDALVVAPHPDDAELGMAGTILLLKKQGWKVGVLDLTSGEPTPQGTLEIRARETAAATQLLGLDWRGNLGLINRCLVADLESRRKLAGALRLLRPRLVFAPYWVDAHPDHVAGCTLVEEARFWCKLSKSDLPGEPCPPPRVLHYFSIHLRMPETPKLVMDITEFWPQKQAVLECFASQFLTERAKQPPALLDTIRDRAAYWGWSIGRPFGEPFDSREPIGLSSVRDVLG